MAVLGSYYNHAVCGANAVDGCRCVLENTDLFDVVLVDIVELSLVFYHTVNDVKRRPHVANLQRCNRSRAAVGLTRVDACYLAYERSRYRCGYRTRYIPGVDAGDGTRERLLFLLNTEALHNHLVEQPAVFFHRYVNAGAVSYGNGLLDEAHIACNEHGFRAFNLEGIMAVGIGYGAVFRAFFGYGNANHGLTVDVGNPSPYRFLLLERGDMGCLNGAYGFGSQCIRAARKEKHACNRSPLREF